MGFVISLARPGGNVTGHQYRIHHQITAKQLELLKEIIPASRASRSCAIRPILPILQSIPAETAGRSWDRIRAAHKMRKRRIDEIADSEWSRPAGGLIVAPDSSGTADFHRELIIGTCSEHRCRCLLRTQQFGGGGLMGYGLDSSTYIDKLPPTWIGFLEGENPADLPVEHRPSSSW